MGRAGVAEVHTPTPRRGTEGLSKFLLEGTMEQSTKKLQLVGSAWLSG